MFAVQISIPYQYTSFWGSGIPIYPCFLKIPAIYQYTACMIWARKKGIPIYLMFSKMAKYTNIPQFKEYQETITSPLVYRYLPYIICAQCMNNLIWIFWVSTGNCRVKLIEILPVPAVVPYSIGLYYIAWLELGSHAWLRDWHLGVTNSTNVQVMQLTNSTTVYIHAAARILSDR